MIINTLALAVSKHRALVLVPLLWLAVACGGKKDDASGAQGPGGNDGGPPKILPYAVVQVQPRTVVLYNDFPATIQGQQNVEIRPKVDGFVEAIYVDEGAAVRKGSRCFTSVRRSTRRPCARPRRASKRPWPT